MQLVIQQQCLLAADCMIYRRTVSSKSAPQSANVVFPAGQILSLIVDDASEVLIYKTSKWPVGQVAKLLDENEIDYVLQ